MSTSKIQSIILARLTSVMPCLHKWVNSSTLFWSLVSFSQNWSTASCLLRLPLIYSSLRKFWSINGPYSALKSYRLTGESGLTEAFWLFKVEFVSEFSRLFLFEVRFPRNFLLLLPDNFYVTLPFLVRWVWDLLTILLEAVSEDLSSPCSSLYFFVVSLFLI